MRTSRPGFLLFLSSLIPLSLSAQQSVSTGVLGSAVSDPQAVSLLKASLAAMGGSTGVPATYSASGVAKKSVALVVIFGIPALLCLGLAYDTLSPREWAIWLLAWFVTLVLWTTMRKLAAKKTVEPSVEPAIALDDDTRGRIMREIWMRKVWIGILAVLLPVGIANGIAHRAWLPTLVGVGISLSLMYVTAQEIMRRRKRINLTRE